MKSWILPSLAFLLVVFWIYIFFTVTSHLVISDADELKPIAGNNFWVFSTLGALITSVSIVELGIKPPGSSTPKFGIALSAGQPIATDPARWVSLSMLVGWLLVAAISFYYGFVWDQNSLPARTHLWKEGMQLVD